MMTCGRQGRIALMRLTLDTQSVPLYTSPQKPVTRELNHMALHEKDRIKEYLLDDVYASTDLSVKMPKYRFSA